MPRRRGGGRVGGWSLLASPSPRRGAAACATSSPPSHPSRAHLYPAATRDIFVTRTKIINFVRRFLDMHGFLEVETPMMNMTLTLTRTRTRTLTLTRTLT